VGADARARALFVQAASQPHRVGQILKEIMKTPMKKPATLVLVLLFVAAFVALAKQQSMAQPGKGKGGAAALYQQHCVKCHSANGKGIESLQPPDFTDAKWQASNSDKSLANGIANGKGTMPGYKNTLSATQISSLVKHVRAFAPKTTAKKK
jgi:mono/diheme cytochrome c family protein